MPNTTQTSIKVTRFINAPIEQAFNAWSSATNLEHWFLAGEGWHATSHTDFVEGGSYEHTLSDNKGTELKHTGIYKEIKPYSKLVLTWNSPVVQNALLTIEFTQKDDGTELVLTHECLPDKESCDQHIEGWKHCLGSLAKFVTK